MRYPDVNFFARKRYFVCFWTFVGHILLYVLRSNLSIAIVEMTSEKTFTSENGTVIKLPPAYDWDSKEKGIILSLFAYGYFFTPIGGLLTGRYGGTTVFGAGIAVTALLTALSPFLLQIHLILFSAARVLEGVFESFAVAAAVIIFAAWAPPQERTRLNLLGFAGSLVGLLFNYSICGFLAQWMGYGAVFTVTGGITLIWYVIWCLFISNSPNSDRFITQTEKNYFKNFPQYVHEKKKLSYPWKKILTSKPVWAVFNEYFCYTWTYTFISFYFPLFVKDVFNVNVQMVGFISSVPILGGIIGMVVSAFLADYHKKLKKKNTVYIAHGQLTCVIFLLIIGFSTNFTGSIICFTLMRMLSTTADVSYFVLFIDSFGEYAAMIRGLAGIFSNIALILNSIVMGFMTANHSRSEWNLYFLILSMFSIFSLIIFYVFGSGELQEWAEPKNENETDI